MLTGKRILLIIGGGIAAYKSLDLIRRLKQHGADVTGVLSGGASAFITALSVANLSGNRVYTDLFDAALEGQMGHIELSRTADLIVVAPATANLMARMANGHADDLATTLLLATDTPVLIAPAMNVRMWQHAATQRNLAQLLDDAVLVTGPAEGDMACGEFGYGRMSEPEQIVAACTRFFDGQTARPLSGRRVLVTAGPTHEPIDPVRYLANRSSGKQGFAIARAAANLGAQCVLVAGPTGLPTPDGVVRIDVETGQDMLAACQEALPVDLAIFAAAVADWRPVESALEKMKKGASGAPSLSLVENPDILRTIAGDKKKRPRLVIGFAAETEEIVDHARKKRVEKGCDWLVANDVSPSTGIMGGNKNRVTLITGNGIEDWPEMTKSAVAEKLLDRAAAALSKDPEPAK